MFSNKLNSVSITDDICVQLSSLLASHSAIRIPEEVIISLHPDVQKRLEYLFVSSLGYSHVVTIANLINFCFSSEVESSEGATLGWEPDSIIVPILQNIGDVTIISRLIYQAKITGSKLLKLSEVIVALLINLSKVIGVVWIYITRCLIYKRSLLLPKRHPRRKDEGEGKRRGNSEKLSHGCRRDCVQENEVAW